MRRFSVRENTAALLIAADHHVICDIHRADKAHAETVLGHEGKADAQIKDIAGLHLMELFDDVSVVLGII